jgi:hypothetical protein
MFLFSAPPRLRVKQFSTSDRIATSMISADERTADRQIAEWLFLLTFVVYGWFYAGAGWNQNSQFDLTRAMVEQHTFAIDRYAFNTGDVARHGGHVYSNKSPAISWLAAIPYALVHALESNPSDPIVLGLNNYFSTLAVVVPFGALIPALLYGFARRHGWGPVWSATVALTIAFATQLMPYSTMLMLHVPSAALMLVALTTRSRPLSGFAAGLATAMNYLCAPLVILAMFVGNRQPGPSTAERRRRNVVPGALSYLLGALPPLLALVTYDKICFGSFTTISIAREDARFLQPDAVMGIFGRPSLEALYGITISPYRGLFYFSPVLIMALGGATLWLRSSLERRGSDNSAAGQAPATTLAIIAVLSAVFFGFNVTFNGWEGGFGVGGRYLVPLIPLWGMAMLYCRSWLRPALVSLAVLSFVINFAATAVDPQPSATIPRPLTQYILPLLTTGHFGADVPITAPWSSRTFTGHTSVNRLAHDEAVVFSRHLPGSAAAEWSSFNLGEPFFGAGNAASLIPIVLILAGGTVAILRKARRVQAA